MLRIINLFIDFARAKRPFLRSLSHVKGPRAPQRARPKDKNVRKDYVPGALLIIALAQKAPKNLVTRIASIFGARAHGRRSIVNRLSATM